MVTSLYEVTVLDPVRYLFIIIYHAIILIYRKNEKVTEAEWEDPFLHDSEKSEKSSFCLPELQCQIFIIIPEAIVTVLMFMNDSYDSL